MKGYNYSLLAEHYDILEDNGEIQKINHMLDNLLQKNNVKTVLDLTCGTGAQSIFLHKQGYQVTASDYCQEMIDIAKRKTDKLKFYCADMRNAQFEKHDAVITIYNSIAHLTPEDFEKALENIKSNLNHGGVYIFDIFNLHFLKENLVNQEFIDVAKEVDEVKYVRFNNNRLNIGDGIMNVNQKTYIQKGIEEPNIFEESWDMQTYSPNRLKQILERNGYSPLILSMDGNEFDNGLSILCIATTE